MALENEVHQLRQVIGDLKFSQQEEQQKNQVLLALQRAQQAGDIRGFHGRLGDLGAIDKAYDIAITSACPQLNQFVVETVEDASRCIAFLREHRIGRGTFISLEKTHYIFAQSHQKFTAPRQAKRLYDLIEFQHEQYKPVFYSVLRNTLVCDNLEIATELGYGDARYRCVTKDGVVIESSGAMTGSGKPKSGGMGSSLFQRSQNLSQEYDRNMSNLQDQLMEIKIELGALEQELKIFEQEDKELKKEETRLNQKIDFEKQNIKDIDHKLAQIQKMIASQTTGKLNKQKLQEKIDMQEDQLKAKQVQIDALRTQLLNLDDKIDKISGQDFMDQKTKFQKLKQEQKEIADTISKRQASFKTFQKKLTIVENTLKTEEASLSQQQKSLETIKQKIKSLEEESVSILSQKSEIIQKKDDLYKQFNQNDSEKQAYDQLIKEITDSIKAAESEFEEAQTELQKAKTQQTQATHELAELRKTALRVQKDYTFLDALQHIEAFKVTDLALQDKKVKREWGVDMLQELDIHEDLDEDVMDSIMHLKPEMDTRIIFESENLNQMMPNLQAIQDFKQKYFEFKSCEESLNACNEALKEAMRKSQEARKQRLDSFLAGFDVIAGKLKEVYRLITNGGDAALELVDSLDPFSEGIQFSVRPPKKTWKSMMKLSGGEKTLASLALVFALHHYKPTPLYFMDEIDAALDFKNVRTVGLYICQRTQNAQFIIISLRNHMFELSNQLVGIYKTDNCTKTVILEADKQEPEESLA